MGVKMDDILTNNLVLAFQLVSEKEKKKNLKIVELTRKIVFTVLEIKEMTRGRNAKK
jgi:hypothetical protein